MLALFVPFLMLHVIASAELRPRQEPVHNSPVVCLEPKPALAHKLFVSASKNQLRKLSHQVWRKAGLSRRKGVVANQSYQAFLTTGLLTPGHISIPSQVTVRDPEKVEHVSKIGIKSSHVTYLVRTDSSLEGFKADGMEVRRRFSEFEVSTCSICDRPVSLA